MQYLASALSGGDPIFKDRKDAGRLLARELPSVDAGSAIVVALPRGGLPVAAEIARALQLPLDIVLIRKVGAPGQPELAVAAVSDGARMNLSVNRDVADMLGLDDDAIETLARQELPELERRRGLYRGNRPELPLSGKTVIVVDDGVATGATAKAALRLIRQRGAARTILALPVAPRESVEELRREADDIVCLQTPAPFYSVGTYYADFAQVADREVIRILNDAGQGAEGDKDDPIDGSSDTRHVPDSKP